MKKSDLMISIAHAIFGGILSLMTMLVTDKLSGLFFGLSFACIVAGVSGICKYIYWDKAENRERYQERLEEERIELHDELKVRLRDKSGRYAYIFGLITISVSIILFSILGAFDVLDPRIMILFLGGYLVSQYLAGILFFKHLLKKY